jgi:ethanolaminephosphotransferase
MTDQDTRSPIVQTTPQRQALVIYAYLFISFAIYGHFVHLVINDITDYLGIACFTVRKKNEAGNWEDAKKVDAKKRE